MRHSRHWLLLGLLCLSLLTPPARPVAAQSGPEDATIEAVRAYFQLINDRRYREAWTYLDPAGALANTTTFEEWSRGYATTESLRVEYTMLGGKFDTVYVALRAVDNTPSGRTARRFAGWFRLNNRASGWKLANGNLRQVTLNIPPGMADHARFWNSHGYHLDIAENGLGAVEARTYTPCRFEGDPLPCDSIVEVGGASMILDGFAGLLRVTDVAPTGVNGIVLESSDDSVPRGTTFRLTYGRLQTAELRFSAGGGEPRTLCGPDAYDLHQQAGAEWPCGA